MARMMSCEANGKATSSSYKLCGRAPRFPLGEVDGITHAADASRGTKDSEKDTLLSGERDL
jgi:hypothetical protein